jgi:hypothetical protein
LNFQNKQNYHHDGGLFQVIKINHIDFIILYRILKEISADIIAAATGSNNEIQKAAAAGSKRFNMLLQFKLFITFYKTASLNVSSFGWLRLVEGKLGGIYLMVTAA